jgi:hypothetical protein
MECSYEPSFIYFLNSRGGRDAFSGHLCLLLGKIISCIHLLTSLKKKRTLNK